MGNNTVFILLVLSAVTGVIIGRPGSPTLTTEHPPQPQRVAAHKNVLGESVKKHDFHFAFLTDLSDVKWSHGIAGGSWADWASLGEPKNCKIFSNIATTYFKTQVMVFGQCSDGQVYYTIQKDLPSDPLHFTSWQLYETRNKLPQNASVSLKSFDTVAVYNRSTSDDRFVVNVFARSVDIPSALYWCVGNGTMCDSTWMNIGGNFASDISFVLNRFSGYFEAFGMFTDGKLYRSYQYDERKWSGWTSIGVTQPSFVATMSPTAHSMGTSMFNGFTEVFMMGNDGYVHHIWQTTCDHVHNVWGFCTWWVWEKLGERKPSVILTMNALFSINNIHNGNEVFTIDDNGLMWRSYQTERSADWSNWEAISPMTSSVLPSAKDNGEGWWAIFYIDQQSKLGVIRPNASISASPSKLAYGNNLTVNWSVPVDEGVNKDWIGVYPDGLNNDLYVDFRYVQGGQNPLHNAVPAGNVTMNLYLPDNTYNVRYLVNKKYIDVLDTNFNSFNMSHEKDWVQLFTGLSIGLGNESHHFDECWHDGADVVDTFEKAFEAFEDRKIIAGLNLLGEGLAEFLLALKACEMTDVVQRIEKFVNDLVACTGGSCAKFAIDVAEEILILYEDIYEIYGDIRAAKNSISLIKAYQQGGLCIGRVVSICSSLPN